MTKVHCRTVSASSVPVRAVERTRLCISARSLVVRSVAAASCLLMTLSSAWASCCGPSEPDPVSEAVAKAVVVGGILAFVGYRYYKQSSPRG